jgi:hypothetical protein
VIEGEIVAPTTMLLGCWTKAKCVGAPATSVSVPKLVVEVTPVIDAVPEFVMLPLPSGVPVVGRTLMPDQVRRDRVFGLPPLPSTAVMVIVIVVAVTVAFGLCRITNVSVPAKRDTVTVTAEVVSKTNPDGAFKVIVPVVAISLLAPSSMTGPVNVVYAPPAVSAEMEAEASVVTVPAANAFGAPIKINSMNSRKTIEDGLHLPPLIIRSS